MTVSFNLNLKGKKILIIGGGRVATRKIKSLFAEQAIVRVISPIVSTSIRLWVEQGKINWLQRKWQHGDCSEAFLVIAATDNPEVNLQIAMDCNDFQLLCVIDQPEQSTISFPATLRRGRLTVSVATDGASPLFSRQLRDKIGSDLADDTADYLDFLHQLRRSVFNRISDIQERKWWNQEALRPEYHDRKKQAQLLSIFHSEE